MNVFKFFERLMTMDDETWARHANPWSVWTRFTCLPLLVLALWSRAWLGSWALIPVALALFWIWYNPRAFSPPANTDHWTSKATLGERIFIERDLIPIPKHHEYAAWVLTMVSSLGVLILVYGIVMLDVWSTLFGLMVSIGAKTWYADRMVWLYHDVENDRPA